MTVAKFWKRADMGNTYVRYPINVIDINAERTVGLVGLTAAPAIVM